MTVADLIKIEIEKKQKELDRLKLLLPNVSRRFTCDHCNEDWEVDYKCDKCSDKWDDETEDYSGDVCGNCCNCQFNGG